MTEMDTQAVLEPVKPKGRVGRPPKQPKRQATEEPEVEADEPPRASSSSKADEDLQKRLAAVRYSHALVYV